jgi:oligopeptide/dipeptide ABC transporter ATP-binding protein
MIFQGAMNALNPVHTVGRQIREPLVRHRTTLDSAQPIGAQIGGAVARHEGLGKGAARDRRVGELLNLVGIPPSRHADYPHQFSGGMRQRVMIAMALACSPHVIIADEPTTALDVIVQAQILDLILHLRDQLGLAVLLVTHDLGVVAEVCDRVMVMYAGVVAETGTVDQVYHAPAHPYTQRLLAAFPTLGQGNGRLAAIPGAPPRLDDLPPGCRFAPRCPHCFAPCTAAQPPRYAVPTAPDHTAACYLLAEPGR